MKNRIHFLAQQTAAQMLGFVIETADGKIIVIDGGQEMEDVQHLLQVLRQITGQSVPTVNAWFLTHPHYDHTGALINILTHCPDAVNIEHVYLNFPSRQFLARNDGGIGATHIDKFYAVRHMIADIEDVVTQGDSYTIGGAVIDVLYSHDPAFTAEAYNDSSLVLRLTLAGQTVLFLADLAYAGGQKLLAMHGDALKSDFVQMAHHGQGGAGQQVYNAIAPKACFWATPRWIWDNDIGAGPGTHTWKTADTKQWMAELGVRHHFVAKDGNYTIELPYDFDGPVAQPFGPVSTQWPKF